MRASRSLLAGIFAALAATGASASGRTLLPARSPDAGLHAIKHVVIVTQENRSFDSYFGTYPGANGIPMSHGVPTVCVPDPASGTCVPPYPYHADANYGGPHYAQNAAGDIDGGKMDGFIAQEETWNGGLGWAPKLDVMGYHDGSDIPNYWGFAQRYVLQDAFYSPLATWSLPVHVQMVSAWSADCPQGGTPLQCNGGKEPGVPSPGDPTPYLWTDITYLLNAHHVSWASYLDDPNGNLYWNVLPGFADVASDGQLGNVQPLENFFAAAHAGTLPAVSWIIPSFYDSEHPYTGKQAGLPPGASAIGLVSQGEAYVTSLVDTIMASPDWQSTAIFVWWDDWGGFYDHAVPPAINDPKPLGIRVPALVISPFAKRGLIDHQVLSSDAYLKFIEDDFLGGARLNPNRDGRPDSRPTVRETNPVYGDLTNDFDFTQSPRAPEPLWLPRRSRAAALPVPLPLDALLAGTLDD